MSPGTVNLCGLDERDELRVRVGVGESHRAYTESALRRVVMLLLLPRPRGFVNKNRAWRLWAYTPLLTLELSGSYTGESFSRKKERKKEEKQTNRKA
jgi:hypothetical protein